MPRPALVASLLLGLCAACAQSPAGQAKAGVSLDHVVDGDTIWVKGDEKLKVRLLRIDAPERNEPGYEQATNQLKRLIKGVKSLRLEYEEERRDRHGRELCYLWADGKLVNLEMVRSGWARYFDRYGKGKFERKFRQAESEAKIAKLGIWATSR